MKYRQVCSDRILIFTNKVLYPRPGLGLAFVVTVGMRRRAPAAAGWAG